MSTTEAGQLEWVMMLTHSHRKLLLLGEASAPLLTQRFVVGLFWQVYGEDNCFKNHVRNPTGQVTTTY